jgi:hypothetical protein
VFLYRRVTPRTQKNRKEVYEPERNAICAAGGEVYIKADSRGVALIPNEQEFDLDLTKSQWSRVN